MKKLNHKNALSATVSMLMTLVVCQSVSVQASDIDIYSNSTGGQTRIMFVLDTSLSMASTWDGMACDAPSGATIVSRGNTSTVSASIVNGVSIPSYTRYYCRIREGSETRNVNDRITKLIDGMLDVLAGRNGITRLTDDIEVGLTRFSGNTGTNGSGLVLVPTRRLDASANATSGCTAMTQRDCLVRKVAELRGTDRTPTGPAYGVAAKSLLNTIGSDTSECNGNGIYFLSDGGPSGQSDVANTQDAMSAAISGFTCPTSWNSNITSVNSTYEFKPMTGSTNNQSIWQCIAKFNQTLLNGGTNRPKIKTASVGFGSFYEGLVPYTGHERDKVGILTSSNIDIANILSNYNSITNAWGSTIGGSSRADIANTALWGIYGRGGWYSASQPRELAESILNFVDNVKPTFDPIATGAPTLPQDALNPLRIQPYGYYASFVPKPQETTQLWVGNMNKYHIYNGELYNNSKTIRLIKADGSLDSTAEGLWINGMKGQLPLGIGTNAANEKIANRTLYTNREITGTAASYAASEIGSLKKVNVATLFGTGSTALFVNDPEKNYWLNLLGYNVAATGTVTLDDLITKPELRQVGSVMHSTPILLTQSGKISYTSGTIDTTDRDDYLLFGSTQGLLHVVRAGKNATDADRGKEVFAFAPNEMMQNQKNAFLSETSSTLGKNNLFYGIDAPWTAYTQYVAKADGTLTVKDSGRVAQNASGDDIAIKGLQWVYGGLRMGGKSYYALNLSDLDNPELKFHIDPASSKIYKSSSTTTGVTALSYMGQSWSKPTIAYVKFGGVKKLVMFVGGGYDATGETTACNATGETAAKNIGYECAKYNQSNGKGAGVYMFDANNGDLLWWASANATAAGGAEAFTDASAATINMKYSVVSQINAIDRDSDGLVDNLYFGDLGGQGFRVDLNNAATGADASAKKANFAKRVVRLFDEHATGGASPRFYEMPSVSIHEDNGYVAAVAFSSGNRSSPLVGAAVVDGNQAGSTTSATDGVFVVYDKDVAKTDLYASPTLTTQNISFSSLNTNISTGVPVTGNNGWKYIYSNIAGVYKGMNELYALDGMLYVNVFHRDGTGIGGSCGAGVKGDSYVYQFCLPTGKCPFNTTTSGVPNSVKLGAGILGAGLGQGRSSANNTGLIVNRPNTLNCTTSPNLPECQEFTTTAKLRQLRWYESR
ncbi:pilus assembly protein PilC [Acinetobacter haemolyticus]|uniref:pilus assembly protein PilC n=1 Tax=Acinetobacter haemolyticus TaxID=29430 RepID=UPI0021D27FAD|nr:pilus assembly protein PilC [Acinetobacter haemolyticus]MCU4388282.1 pilus assembly protein PilC [Acinetobacter haemolyticus]